MNKQKKIWQRLLPGMVVVGIIVVFFVVFMINNNKHVTMQNGNYVSDATDQTASRIADNLYTAIRTLNNISEVCDADGESAYPEKLKKIDDSIFSMIDYIAVEESFVEGGVTYYHGKLFGFRNTECKPGNTPDRVISVTTKEADDAYSSSFALGMTLEAGAAGMQEEFTSITGADSDLMSFYTSVYSDGGEKVGVLVGRYDENKMKEILTSTFFNEPSGVFLCNGVGTVITTTDSYLNSGETKGSNILDLLRGRVAESKLKTIEMSLKNGTFGQVGKVDLDFSYGKGTVNACLKQLPLEDGVSADNWMILQTFPATVTARMQTVANLEGLQLGLGLSLALAIYIVLILLLGHYQNRKLVKENTEMTYVVDGLAKLYDRFIYVNLNDEKYQYIGDTYPADCEIPREGNYADFKSAMLATFLDDYERADLANRLEIGEIRSDMQDGTAHLRYEYRAKDSHTRWDDLSLICLSRDEGGAKEVLFARQNISELKEKELHNQVVLREAFRAAEDANRAKSDFLSAMSHDIRTPMNAVLGFSALIEQSVDNPVKVAEYNKKIQAAGQHLIGLINDLLDMSKIESGKFTLNLSQFSMAGLLEEIGTVMAAQAREKGHTFTVNTENLLHDAYLGDRLRISQILFNLVSNAIKYTPEGGTIDVTVQSGEQLSDSIANVVFTVKDNGIGMSEEFRKKLFTPFEREERSVARKVQGTGLGMAITKNLIDLMGGTIEVESAENVGTTFTIVLHLVTVAQTEHPAATASAGETRNPLEGVSFLIAEDNEINAEIIGDLLGLSGAKCEIAENGKIAAEMFERSRSGRYDMILMDVQMPVMNGYEATRTIRESAHPEAKSIPIVAMTANAFAEDVKSALDSGMNAHLAKPVSLDAIKAIVEQLVRKDQ